MDTVIQYALIILLLPLAAFLVQIFFGKRLPRQGDWLPTGTMFVCLLFSILILGRVFAQDDANFKITHSFHWISLGQYDIAFGLLVDNLTAIMLFVVTLVSALVHLYSIGYLHDDVRYSRYFAYLSLFSFSMLGLVLVDSFWSIYVFWELVGVCSLSTASATSECSPAS